MVVKQPYNIMDIQADAGIAFSLGAMAFSAYNVGIGHNSMTLHNFIVGFIVSTLTIIVIFVAQNCCVKGQAGPTIAIIYSNSLFCSILQIIFQGLIPTLPQILGAFVAFGGILLIIFYN